MKLRISVCAIVVAVVSGLAWAGPGGKVKWRPAKDLEAVLAETKKAGVPLLLYFNTPGTEACAKVDAGVLSDPAAVAAMEEFGRIIIDEKANKEIFTRFSVTMTPTVLMLDYDLKPVGQLALGASEVTISQLHSAIAANVRSPKWDSDAGSALAAGKRDVKPVVLVYKDDGAKSVALLKAFREDTFTTEFFEKCVFAKVEFRADSEDAKKYGIKEAPAVMILDATGAGDPKILKKSTSTKSADLRKEMENAIKKLEKVKAALEKEAEKAKAKEKAKDKGKAKESEKESEKAKE